MFFSNIIGHEFQKKALIRTVRENHTSHAYLFCGPDGIGKKLIAVEFAKILNCHNLAEENSKSEPGNCISCRKIEKAIHPDVFLVEYKGVKDIKVDQIREEIEERLYLTPFEGKFKVGIVDEADRMNLNAQNAFLKTLEEPPSDSVIILISSKPENLLPTIRSRCQSIEFKGIAQEIIVEEIKIRGLSAEEAQVVAKLSEGSIGKALELNAEVLSERKEIITKLSKMNSNQAGEIFSFVEAALKGSEDIEKLSFLFQVVSIWLRDLLLVKTGFGEEALSNRDLAPLARQVAERQSVYNILEKMKVIENAWYAIFRANVNKQIALQHLVLKIVE